MTSGNFHILPISSISINREDRQRRQLDDIPTLADSISRLGLIHPIVITLDNVLVAGERRLAACQSLGWTSIAIQYAEDLDAATLRAIELEENVKRSALPWKDEVLAVNEYFLLRRSENPTFTQEELGTALGLSRQAVSSRLMVAKELLSGNEMITKAPLLSTALGIAERANARRDDKALEEFHKIINPTTPFTPPPDIILTENFNEWAPTYSGPKFNFVHCDFPYGIDADSFNQGAAKTHGGYADSEDTYWTLCSTLCMNLDRLTTDSTHFVFWFSMHFYHQTLTFFEEHSDIKFDPFPLIWMKSDNVGILPDPSRGPRRIYETALFGSRGDRKIVSAVSNAYAAPTDRGFHMSVKPEPVLRHFFRMFVDDSTIMLDPTAGSGSALRAADSLSAKHIVGLEINPDFAEQSNRAFRTAHNMRKVK